MPQVFKVDQSATFTSVVLLECTPKQAFGSTEQEKAKDGTPKWELQLVAGFRDGFGATKNEVIKVGCVSERNPGADVPPLTPIELIGFEVGVMDKVTRDRDTGQRQMGGAQIWYRVERIRSTAATSGGSNSKRLPDPAAA